MGVVVWKRCSAAHSFGAANRFVCIPNKKGIRGKMEGEGGAGNFIKGKPLNHWEGGNSFHFA
jgi:hypothetical protein